MSHLNALRLGLSHERERLRCAKSLKEKELRQVWVAQREREIAAELKFLGITENEADSQMNDDELLAALMD